MADPASGALAGIRVVDLTRILAGPLCAMMLGDMGADVIKIEPPGTGDDTRGWGPPFVAGEAAYFLGVNRNKRSLTLNLATASGKEILATLIAKADVVIDNFKLGTLEKWGFGDASLRMATERAMTAAPIEGVLPAGGERRLFIVRFPKPIRIGHGKSRH